MHDFELVCIPRLPEIDTIKKRMLEKGAVCCQMSGSGSAVFGLFDSHEAAEAYEAALKSDGLTEVYSFDDADFEKMYKGE